MYTTKKKRRTNEREKTEKTKKNGKKETRDKQKE